MKTINLIFMKLFSNSLSDEEQTQIIKAHDEKIEASRQLKAQEKPRRKGRSKAFVPAGKVSDYI